MPRQNYSPIENFASGRFSQIKSRTKETRFPIQKTWERKDFIAWYVANLNNGCFYCGISVTQSNMFRTLLLRKFKSEGRGQGKLKTRGKSFEIDRKDGIKYSSENCVLACYFCNNAKSDIFSSKEFEKLGAEIGKIIGKKG